MHAWLHELLLQGLAADARGLLHFRKHNRRGAAITYAALTALLAGMGAWCMLTPEIALAVRASLALLRKIDFK